MNRDSWYIASITRFVRRASRPQFRFTEHQQRPVAFVLMFWVENAFRQRGEAETSPLSVCQQPTVAYKLTHRVNPCPRASIYATLARLALLERLLHLLPSRSANLGHSNTRASICTTSPSSCARASSTPAFRRIEQRCGKCFIPRINPLSLSIGILMR